MNPCYFYHIMTDSKYKFVSLLQINSSYFVVSKEGIYLSCNFYSNFCIFMRMLLSTCVILKFSIVWTRLRVFNFKFEIQYEVRSTLRWFGLDKRSMCCLQALQFKMGGIEEAILQRHLSSNSHENSQLSSPWYPNSIIFSLFHFMTYSYLE